MGVRVRVTDPSNDDKAPWFWRRRVGLTPFYFGATAGAAALLSRLLDPWQVSLGVLILAGAAGYATQVKWGEKKKDRSMRNFVWAVIATFSIFVLASRNDLLDAGWTFILLLGGVFGLGAFWWLDSWNRRRVLIERDVERWPLLAKKLGMEAVKRGPCKTTETGRRWRFWWDEGDYTLAAFRAQARALESALGIPENRIRFEAVFEGPGLKSPNSIIVSEHTESAILKEPVAFTHPTMSSIMDPMFVGMREDNSRHDVVWFEEDFGGMHTLAAGATGSGKSGLYHLVMAESAYCPDLIRWGIDAKGGMALRPWASLFDWMVTDVDQSFVMLSALHNVLKKRSEYAAERGWGCWEPDADHPVLLLLIDEAAEVFGLDQFDLNALIGSIARMGRAAGVLLLLATQYPTNEAIGSQQLMKNVRRRFCFAVEDQQAQRVVIPRSTELFDASDIPTGKAHAGTYYSSEGGEICAVAGRVRFVTPFDVYKIVLEVGADNSPVAVPDLDDLSQEAARQGSVLTDEDGDEIGNAYDERRIFTVHDAKPPKGWVQTEPQDEIAAGHIDMGKPGALGSAPVQLPVHEPASEPVQIAARALPHEPPRAPNGAPAGAPPAVVHRTITVPVYDPATALRGVPDPVDPDDPEPWSEGDPPMNIADVVAPRSEEEAAEIERRIAEYTAQFAETNVSPLEAERMLDRILDAAPPQGIKIEEMRKTLIRSASWYSNKLRARLLAKPPTVKRLEGHRYARPEHYIRTAPIQAVPDLPADANA